MKSLFQPVALAHASRLLNFGPTVLITSRHGDVHNVMAAAWSMPVEFTPPRVAVVIDKNTYTKQLIAQSGYFGICIPGAVIADLVMELGSCSGRDGDKFSRFQLPFYASATGAVPLIEQGCSAWLECRLIPEPHTEQQYDTCFAEVIAAAADPRIFANSRWQVTDENRDLHSIHHLGAGHFLRGTPLV